MSVKLIQLRLENFRQYREAQFDFRDGMTAIVGPNGAGKSTVLEAITFALFGAQRPRSKREDLRFNLAEPRAKLRVGLTFEFDGRTFVLQRTEKDASLLEGSTMRATGLSEVRAACERLLHLNYEQFKNSFCTEQKGLAFLQFQNDTRKQEQVARMLGFDRLRTASTLARDRGRGLRIQALTLQSMLGSADEIKAQIEAISGESKAAEAQIKAREAQVAIKEKESGPTRERKAQAERYQNLSNELGILCERANQLRKNREAAKGAKEDAAKQVARTAELAPSAARFETLEQEVLSHSEAEKADVARRKDEERLAEIRVRASELTKQIDALRLPDLAAIRESVKAAIAAHDRAESDSRIARDAWVKDLAAAEGETKSSRDAMLRAQRESAKARELAAKGICPECGQPTGKSFDDKLAALAQEAIEREAEHEKMAAGLKTLQGKPTALEMIESKVEQTKQAHTQAQANLEDATAKHNQSRVHKEVLEQAHDEIAKLKKHLADHPSQYDRVSHDQAKQQAAELKPRYLEWVRVKDAAAALAKAEGALKLAESDFEEAHRRFKELTEQRKELPFESPEAAKAAIEQSDRLASELQVVRVELRAAQEAKKSAELRLQEVERRMSEHKKNVVLLREAQAQAGLHEKVATEMANLREELNAAIVPELEARACEALGQLTNGRYPVLTLDDEFNATVIDGDVPKQVISGGEEDVVSLALRLALSELIQERQGQPMSLMILDEVFGSLDADRRQAVLERLQGIKGRFNQIFVISHIEEINQVADQCIFLRRDPATQSTVVEDARPDADELILS